MTELVRTVTDAEVRTRYTNILRHAQVGLDMLRQTAERHVLMGQADSNHLETADRYAASYTRAKVLLELCSFEYQSDTVDALQTRLRIADESHQPQLEAELNALLATPEAAYARAYYLLITDTLRGNGDSDKA